MKNEKEKNSRTSHSGALGKNRVWKVTYLSGSEADGIPLMEFL